MTNPSFDDRLGRARWGLRVHRWTTVITTAATGVVLVAFASRLGSASAVAAAALAAAALALAVRRAVAADRRWRHAIPSSSRRGCEHAEEL